MRPWLTVFIKDRFLGGDYEAFFSIDDNDEIWYFEKHHDELPIWNSKEGCYYPNKELEKARIPYWGQRAYS